MRAKLAACDACRFAKLACDHAKPACGRCQKRDAASACTYRTRPFKKKQPVQRKAHDDTQSSRPQSRQQSRLLDQESADPQVDTVVNGRNYPNPGYLGSSSHTTIFHQLSPVLHDDNGNSPSTQNLDLTQAFEHSIDDDQILQGTKLVEDIHRTTRVASCRALIDYWIANSGVNLALAGPLVKSCNESAEHALTQLNGLTQTFQELSRKSFVNSCKPITVNKCSTMDDFFTNFCQENIKWETIGLFFTAVSRATVDVTQFKPLFHTEQQRRALRRAAMRHADRCRDLALSLDCLNDLQLVLQYENFINHTFVDGDQSYHSWKRLGDVISSVFALGYHEKIDVNGACPVFLKYLRQAAVARAYSADKNVSIFLGRPPRMDYKYCTFDFVELSETNRIDGGSEAMQYLGRNSNEPFDYMTDTWWSFECALLKEETMHLEHGMDLHQKTQKASDIKQRAEMLWKSLPHKYQYSGDLILYHYKPIERDFVASARLNYLHVLFQLRLTFKPHVSDQDNELLNVSAEILHLVAKAAVMKDRLGWSGTAHLWRICHYGLPATGVLCLSLLKQPSWTQWSGPSRAAIIQDLSVLVAQVDTGVLIDSSDPNYALLSAATRTIQAILNKVLSGNLVGNLIVPRHSETVLDTFAEDGNASWMPWSNNDGWDFELDFWNNLAGHPFLATNETMS